MPLPRLERALPLPLSSDTLALHGADAHSPPLVTESTVHAGATSTVWTVVGIYGVTARLRLVAVPSCWRCVDACSVLSRSISIPVSHFVNARIGPE